MSATAATTATATTVPVTPVVTPPMTMQRRLRRAQARVMQAALARVVAQPERALWLLRQRAPVQIDAFTLDRAVQAMLATSHALGLDKEVHDAALGRIVMQRTCGLVGVRTDGINTRDLRGGDVPLRWYRARSAPSGPRPVIVYIHGGGYVVGSIDTHDHAVRRLAEKSGCVVLSVEYRLAPEHPFPAAVDDCVAAYRWAREHAAELEGNGVIAVMGDSAGGCLSAVVCLEAKRLGLPQPALQALLYPITDSRLQLPAITSRAEGFALTKKTIIWYRDRYVTREQWEDPRASPLLAPDLSGLAPAIVWTAGFDPLLDDGREYVRALEKARVPTTHVGYDSLIHGFFNIHVVPSCARACDDVAALVGARLQEVQQ